MKKYLPLLLVIVISILSIIPLFHKGFFQSDDGEWMIIRFSAFHQALVAGQFPVRFLPRLYFEYGYPVADFLYPGFMYLGEIFKFLHFGFVNSIKIILALSMVGSGAFTFLWLRRRFDAISAFVGGLIYLFTPYHLYDLYKRGSVGEVLALCVVPFILWQLELENVWWASLGIAFLILAHNTLALLFMPLIIIYKVLNTILSKKKRKTFYCYVCSLILGIGISTFFWLPALIDLSATNFSKIPVANFANYFVDTGLIGYETIAIFLLAVALLLVGRLKWKKEQLTLSLLIAGLIALFFSISESTPFWRILPASVIQFPFRFLSVVILCAAFLSASILSNFAKKQKIIIGGILVVIAFISSKPFAFPSQYFDKGDAFYATNEDSTTVQNEYLPKWVAEKPTSRADMRMSVEQGKVLSAVVASNSYSAQITSGGQALVLINAFYFPGWTAKIDRHEISILVQKNGTMGMFIPDGTHQLNVAFGETPLRLLADGVSIASFLTLIIFTVSLHKKNEKV